ncbi:hypothetical protein ACOSP7_023701 [Xanthoceras sorbifolium]
MSYAVKRIHFNSVKLEKHKNITGYYQQPNCLNIQMELCEITILVKKKKIDKKTLIECFLDESKNIKISDFGLVNFFKENGQPFTNNASIGNKIYRTPEMRKANSKTDEKVDIYCLSVILFELLYSFETTNYLQTFISELLSKEPSNRPLAAKILEQHPWKKSKKVFKSMLGEGLVVSVFDCALLLF